MGTIALATLLQEQGLLANPALAGAQQHFDLTPKPAHGFGKAKARRKGSCESNCKVTEILRRDW